MNERERANEREESKSMGKAVTQYLRSREEGKEKSGEEEGGGEGEGEEDKEGKKGGEWRKKRRGREKGRGRVSQLRGREMKTDKKGQLPVRFISTAVGTCKTGEEGEKAKRKKKIVCLAPLLHTHTHLQGTLGLTGRGRSWREHKNIDHSAPHRLQTTTTNRTGARARCNS